MLTYLHGVRECENVIAEIQAEGLDIDLIEMRSLKPLDIETIRASLAKTHKASRAPSLPPTAPSALAFALALALASAHPPPTRRLRVRPGLRWRWP